MSFNFYQDFWGDRPYICLSVIVVVVVIMTAMKFELFDSYMARICTFIQLYKVKLTQSTWREKYLKEGKKGWQNGRKRANIGILSIIFFDDFEITNNDFSYVRNFFARGHFSDISYLYEFRILILAGISSARLWSSFWNLQECTLHVDSQTSHLLFSCTRLRISRLLRAIKHAHPMHASGSRLITQGESLRIPRQVVRRWAIPLLRYEVRIGSLHMAQTLE